MAENSGCAGGDGSALTPGPSPTRKGVTSPPAPLLLQGEGRPPASVRRNRPPLHDRGEGGWGVRALRHALASIKCIQTKISIPAYTSNYVVVMPLRALSVFRRRSRRSSLRDTRRCRNALASIKCIQTPYTAEHAAHCLATS